jgi:hypothetical protein
MNNKIIQEIHTYNNMYVLHTSINPGSKTLSPMLAAESNYQEMIFYFYFCCWVEQWKIGFTLYFSSIKYLWNSWTHTLPHPRFLWTYLFHICTSSIVIRVIVIVISSIWFGLTLPSTSTFWYTIHRNKMKGWRLYLVFDTESTWYNFNFPNTYIQSSRRSEPWFHCSSSSISGWILLYRRIRTFMIGWIPLCRTTLYIYICICCGSLVCTYLICVTVRMHSYVLQRQKSCTNT